jgi:predicted RNase H-like HicB family nuclease
VIDMLYPVYVHQGDTEHAHAVTIPDFPGCFSAADNWDELPLKVQESIELYCEGEEMTLPIPSSLEQLMKDENYYGGIWMILDIDVTKLNLNTIKVDIILPKKLVLRIEAYSREYQMSRNAFFGLAAQEIMNRDNFFGPL